MMKTTEPAASFLSFALCQHLNKPGLVFAHHFWTCAFGGYSREGHESSLASA